MLMDSHCSIFAISKWSMSLAVNVYTAVYPVSGRTATATVDVIHSMPSTNFGTGRCRLSCNRRFPFWGRQPSHETGPVHQAGEGPSSTPPPASPTPWLICPSGWRPSLSITRGQRLYHVEGLRDESPHYPSQPLQLHRLSHPWTHIM